MEQLYPTDCELSARAAFYDALSSLQAELLSDHGADATLVDALQLMPKHGFAWYLHDHLHGHAIVLAHCKGHTVTNTTELTPNATEILPYLLGLPSCLGLDIESKPIKSPAQSTTSPVPAVTSPALAVTTPAAEDDPEAATESDPSHSTEPLSYEDKQIADGMIRALPPGLRKQFVAAFRAAFNIPKEQQVSTAITEMRHLVFIQRFVSEAEGHPMP